MNAEFDILSAMFRSPLTIIGLIYLVIFAIVWDCLGISQRKHKDS